MKNRYKKNVILKGVNIDKYTFNQDHIHEKIATTRKNTESTNKFALFCQYERDFWKRKYGI